MDWKSDFQFMRRGGNRARCNVATECPLVVVTGLHEAGKATHDPPLSRARIAGIRQWNLNGA